MVFVVLIVLGNLNSKLRCTLSSLALLYYKCWKMQDFIPLSLSTNIGAQYTDAKQATAH